MAELNRFIASIEGSRTASYGTSYTVDVWTLGPRHRAVPEGKSKEKAGGLRNDGGLMRWAHDWPLIPFWLDEGGLAVSGAAHDHARYLQLVKVLSMKFKRITGVTGVHIAGISTGTQFWTQMIAAGYDEFKLTGIEHEWNDDNMVSVTLQCEARRRGVILV